MRLSEGLDVRAHIVARFVHFCDSTIVCCGVDCKRLRLGFFQEALHFFSHSGPDPLDQPPPSTFVWRRARQRAAQARGVPCRKRCERSPRGAPPSLLQWLPGLLISWASLAISPTKPRFAKSG